MYNFELFIIDKPIGPAALHPKDRQSLVIQFMDRQTVTAYYHCTYAVMQDKYVPLCEEVGFDGYIKSSASRR